MNYIPANQFPLDKVKVCNNNVCIEARGKNAELITMAFAFAFVCVGIAVLAKAS